MRTEANQPFGQQCQGSPVFSRLFIKSYNIKLFIKVLGLLTVLSRRCGCTWMVMVSSVCRCDSPGTLGKSGCIELISMAWANAIASSSSTSSLQWQSSRVEDNYALMGVMINPIAKSHGRKRLLESQRCNWVGVPLLFPTAFIHREQIPRFKEA